MCENRVVWRLLRGRFRHYKLQGDHRPLQWLLDPSRETSRRQARWLDLLVGENNVPAMDWVPGKTLVVADTLSRRADHMASIPTPREGLMDPQENRNVSPIEDPVNTIIVSKPLENEAYMLPEGLHSIGIFIRNRTILPILPDVQRDDPRIGMCIRNQSSYVHAATDVLSAGIANLRAGGSEGSEGSDLAQRGLRGVWRREALRHGRNGLVVRAKVRPVALRRLCTPPPSLRLGLDILHRKSDR
eukprot:4787126-Pyramimonas_sp.AAC.1